MTVLVRNARQLLTLAGEHGPRRGSRLSELGLVENGAVLVREGRVVAAGPAAEVEALPDAGRAEGIDARGAVVMPGFVDSHTHLIHARPRLADYEMRLEGANYAEIARAGGGILSTVRMVRSATGEQLEQQGKAALRTMHRHGTTTVEAKSGYGLDLDTELRTLEIAGRLGAVPTYLGAHVTPPEFAGRAGEYIEWLCREVMPQVASRALARFADIYCDEGAFSLSDARDYLLRAKELGFGLKMHADQFSRLGGTKLAVELGAISVDHLEHAGAEEVQALASSTTVATLLPGAVFHLGLRCYPPARALIEAGAAVALATDFNPGSSPTCNMQMILSLACTEMRMSPAEAIAAATINGAHALGIGGRAGSLEPGKSADLLVLEVSDYREIPYHFGVNHVRLTMKQGAVIPWD
jgi:imidazolonepropionase